MDAATAQFYASHAQDVVRRYEAVESPVGRYFATAFASGCRVLDVGAGSGRDLAALLALGYDAYGAEPVEAMAVGANGHHPQLAGRIAAAGLPGIGEPFGGCFDGILCSAVLMHVPESDLFDTAFALRNLLRSRGRLLISLPLARADVDTGERGLDGRLFKAYAPEYLQLLFERLGFQRIGRWETEDALERAGTRWYTLLFELRAGGVVRAADQIEGILNRDKKVSTYKLALFRALAELALQEPRSASWRTDGQVGIPVRRIAEKWLGYYWPIFTAPRFVPQSQSEGAGTAKPLLFRRAVQELMVPYRDFGEDGGLTAWQLDLNAGRLSTQSTVALESTLKTIAHAIRTGPVQFAGGSLESGSVFTYDARAGQVLMASDLWRELSLLGHWIADAVILRWAELTERFSRRQGIHAGDVLPLLLARAEPERGTYLARQVFMAEGVDRCAWSDRKLAAGFAVDHVIPFSLWGNSDLWNLMPSHPKVNGEKSDRLPAGELLLARRSSITENWQLLRDAMPEAFGKQAAHLIGRAPNGGFDWSPELFMRLREAVELTALQRGVERWVPARA